MHSSHHEQVRQALTTQLTHRCSPLRSIGTDKRFTDNHDLGIKMDKEHTYPYQVRLSCPCPTTFMDLTQNTAASLWTSRAHIPWAPR